MAYSLDYYTSVIKSSVNNLTVQRTHDPMLVGAKKLGFKITLYTPRPAPWGNFFTAALHQQIFLSILVAFMYSQRATPNALSRQFVCAVGVGSVLLWPLFYGKTGLGVIDFGMPAYGFLGSLHIVEVFLLRNPKELESWSFRKFYTTIFTFPREENLSPNPRWENLKALGGCGLKFLMVNILLYAAPPPEIMAQVDSKFAFIGYNSILGLCVLGTLGFLIEGILRLQGLIWGVEQHEMFHNPLGATNIRDFWGRWNLAIKVALHRVIFHFKQAQKQGGTAISKKPANGAANGSGKNGKAIRHHRDMLSETEASADEAGMDKMQAAKRQAVEKKRSEQKEAKAAKKRSSFAKKAFMAIITFLASGLFHEYMNALAFGGATGENVTFFLVHGVATVVYTYFSRTFPSANNMIPSPVAIIVTNALVWSSAPLFCMPFIRAGFFEDLKAIGIFGPVRGFIHLYEHPIFGGKA
ncbi:uncharacterized protein L969DRAFT_84751 [Mixia osmundae IAM 14324]|nr:uncharacterized protein L969DRAFT_84751 [Mixia osmundae IAM 14324]KEI42861.1 hypothetical protein L969DRAFT_84751 [Mixia osmundae IAM 14324]